MSFPPARHPTSTSPSCIPTNTSLQEPAAARGALQTDYHIKLMAYHIQETEGALFTASYQIGDDLYDTKYPVGALALATVAVSVVYESNIQLMCVVRYGVLSRHAKPGHLYIRLENSVAIICPAIPRRSGMVLSRA